MIHAREDYTLRFGYDPALDDPSLLSPGSTPIAVDEPVMLFRAQDIHMLEVLTFFGSLIEADVVREEVDPNVLEPVKQHIARVSAWQREHPPKYPDL